MVVCQPSDIRIGAITHVIVAQVWLQLHLGHLHGLDVLPMAGLSHVFLKMVRLPRIKTVRFAEFRAN